MADFNTNLFKMRGRVRQVKRSAGPSLIDSLINDVIRRVIDSRPYWSDTLYRGVWNFPTPTTSGTVSVQNGSTSVLGDAGSGTNWPVSDIINGTLPNGVTDIGYQDIMPDSTSLLAITPTSILLVDAGTPSQEIVPVVRISTSEGTFTGQFRFTHAPGCTITQSSLAGLQISFGYGSPNFTVLAVNNPAQLTMDNPWGALALPAGTAYTIQMSYVTTVPNWKDFIINGIVDQLQALPLKHHIPQSALNVWDPQRSSGGDPRCVVDLGVNVNGLIQYEIWPPTPTARQISYLGYTGWPELVLDTDRPPPFIDPMVFVNGAIGEALRINLGSRTEKDPWYLPRDADAYDVKYAMSLATAVNADESKAIKAYTANYEALYGGANSLWALEHDPDVLYQNF
jgi:hypothetical protein